MIKLKKAELAKKFKGYEQKINKKLDEYADNKESWHYLEVIITILATTFFLIFAIRPAVVTISGLVGEIKEKEELSEQMQTKINSVIQAQDEFAYVQGKRALLESFLPSDFAISQGIVQVAGATTDSGLDVNNINISEVDNMVNPSQDLSGLEFNLSASGQYSQIEEMIKSVNLVRRWIEVENYNIAVVDEKEAEKGQLRMGLRGKINYWFEELVNERK